MQTIETKNKVAEKFKDFMLSLNLDLENESLKDTPKRVAKMYINELFRGLYEEPPKITTFPNDEKYPGIVLVKNIKIQSFCEHHFLPIIGEASVAYIPGIHKIVGLSKIARIVDFFCRRPQVQERLTKQIYDYLCEILETEDVAVIIKAEHYCMKMRGVSDPCSDTTTSIMGGLFLHGQTTREELFSLLKL